YFDNQRTQARYRHDIQVKEQADREVQVQVRLIELRKPYLDKQFALYSEIAALVGKLLSLPKDGPDWKKSMDRLSEIAKGEIWVMGDQDVSAALVDFLNETASIETVPSVNTALTDRQQVLTHRMGESIRKSWTQVSRATSQ